MQEFRNFLTDARLCLSRKRTWWKIDWVRSSIKSELFVGAFGQQEGMRVQAESDVDVLKALDLMPKARGTRRQRAQDHRRTQPGTSRRQQLVKVEVAIVKGTLSVPFAIAFALDVASSFDVVSSRAEAEEVPAYCSSLPVQPRAIQPALDSFFFAARSFHLQPPAIQIILRHRSKFRIAPPPSSHISNPCTALHPSLSVADRSGSIAD